MMTKRTLWIGSFAILAGAALTACSQSKAPEPAVFDRPTIKLAPPIATVKPGASVTFSHSDVKPVQIGENGAVVITVNEGYPSGIMTLQASAQNGLAVFGASTTLRADMADKTTHEWRVDFQGETDGVHYISVVAEVAPKGGVVETRAYAVRIEVGDWQAAQAKISAETVTEMMPSGESAVILDAQETIQEN